MGDDDQSTGTPRGRGGPLAQAQPDLELVAYDPHWPDDFAATRSDLADLIPGATIKHIGSTSVPGMTSKNTIDVLVGVDDVGATLTPDVVGRLSSQGFEHRPASFADDPAHAFLRRHRPGAPAEHVHVMQQDSPGHTARLLFRDYLRAEPEVAAGYERAKLALLARHERRRYDYVDAKVAVVDALMAEAHQWADRTGWART
jgi:GrpB-like predicted nucleotidyltransferase (UPF0157 family)